MGVIARRYVIFGAAALGGGGVLRFMDGQGQPPTAAWVRDRLWGDKLIAYEVWDGEPRAVVRFGNRIHYDLMVPGDWLWPNWPPAPQWQLMGLGYSIAASDAPATVGFGPCVGISGEQCGRPVDLFGQINDPAIAAMDVQVNGEWRSFPAAAPGYVIRVDGLTTAPARYRWFDGDGREAFQAGDVTPTKPGNAERRTDRGKERRARVSHPVKPAGMDANASCRHRVTPTNEDSLPGGRGRRDDAWEPSEARNDTSLAGRFQGEPRI